MVTMEDVAKAAGVSRKTVYNVLNNNSDMMSKEVREQVLKCVKELNYKPSIAAQSLKTGKTNLIGVVLPNLYHPSYVAQLVDIEVEARKMGYNIIACNYDYKTDLEDYYFDMLYKRNVDGIIYQPFILDNINYDIRTNVIKAKEMGFPIVVLCGFMEKSNFSRVVINEKKAIEDAINFFLKKGYKKPALIYCKYYEDFDYTKLNPNKYHQPRPYWYYTFCKKNNIEPQISVFFNEDNPLKESVKDFLKKDTYDCIICENDHVAVTLYKYYKEIDKEPLPLLGFDNAEYGLICSPKITTFSIDYSTVAKKAMEIVVGEIEGNKKPKKVVVDFEFFERESSK